MSVCKFSPLPFFRELLGSLEGLDIRTAADEDGTEEQRSSLLSEVLDQSDILGTSSTSRQRQWEAKRSVMRYIRMCDRNKKKN